jgi:hypothetical protein
MRVVTSTPNSKTVPEAIRGVLDAVSPNVLREVVIAVTNGKFDFGPWEQVFYGEFDGRRPKRVLVKVIGE